MHRCNDSSAVLWWWIWLIVVGAGLQWREFGLPCTSKAFKFLVAKYRDSGCSYQDIDHSGMIRFEHQACLARHNHLRPCAPVEPSLPTRWNKQGRLACENPDDTISCCTFTCHVIGPNVMLTMAPVVIRPTATGTKGFASTRSKCNRTHRNRAHNVRAGRNCACVCRQ